ncbi:MAG: AAA family ATPase [bacterium]|nr:AAA family ATPase [bacterium]
MDLDFTVVLIGGPPGAGKTTLGRNLAARLGFASLTVDDLVTVGRILTDEVSHPAFHKIARVGATAYYTNNPGERLVADSIEVEEAMWPAVERVIASHVATKGPIVMDWWLLSPRKIAALAIPKVRSLWLNIDSVALTERERRNVGFFGEPPGSEQILSNFMYRSLWRNDLVASQAAESGLPIVQLSGDEPPHDVVERALELLELDRR